jgi:trehalose synthase
VPQHRALKVVPVAPLPIERFGDILDDAGYAEFIALAGHARELLGGRVVWCVNSTANGGGVAEMLRSLLAYTRGAGVDTRWLVLKGQPAFFELTKRIHNCLHGAPGSVVPGEHDRALYEAVTGRAAQALVRMLDPGDVVILHDPQTAGMAPALHAAGVGVIWRVHIGVDDPDATVEATWDFLRPYVAAADVHVFSRERFVWAGLDLARTVIIPPSIDAFSPKNQDLSPAAVHGILSAAGMVPDGGTDDAVFLREDGTPGRVDRHAVMYEEAPLPPGARVVTQVSRWDRLKDPLGVLHGFARHAADRCDAHLVLAGPATAGVSDDPEGAAVLDEVLAAWRALPSPVRARVHLACLPMEDAEENGAIVNALQTRADVVVQKSLAEGFGLTVAEAMWKARPVVVSGVGGIRDQVVDGVNGLIVDPLDLPAFGDALCRLLDDPDLAARLGAAARESVRDHFLEARHLRQWVEAIERLPQQVAVPA